MEEKIEEKLTKTKNSTLVLFIVLIIVMLLCLFFQRNAVMDSPAPLERFIPLIMFLSGGILLKLIRDAKHVNPLILEGGALFCGLCFYMTGIFLFLRLQKDEMLTSGLVFSALLMLAVIYASRSSLTVLFYEIFCGIYLSLSTMPEKRYIFLSMMLFLVPYAVDMYQKEKKRYQTMLFEAGCAMVGLLFFSVSGDSVAFGIWIFNIYAYFLIVLLLHYKFYPVATPYFAAPMKMVGMTGIILLWVYSSHTDKWLNGIIPGADWPINIEFFILLLAVCVLFSENLLRGRVNIEQMLFCAGYYISFALYIFYEFHSPQQMSYINEYFILLISTFCVSGVVLAFRKKDRQLFSLWSGVAMIWVASFFIYNDVIYRMVGFMLVLTLMAACVVHSFQSRRQRR